MNQSESDKCRDDIIYFAEKYLGLNLLNWQRELLNHYNKGEIIFTGGYRSGKNMVVDIIRKHKKLSRA